MSIFCISYRDVFKVNKNDVIFQASPMTFDPSIVNIFLAMSVGASLLVVPESIKLQPSRLAEVLIRNQVSLIQVGAADTGISYCSGVYIGKQNLCSLQCPTTLYSV